MAAPVSSQRPPPNSASGPSVPTARWVRSGEPGSAFSGLSRGGRGRGNGRGRGGGGRGGRGGGPGREAKSTADSAGGDKVEGTAVKITSTPATASKPLPPATNTQEKSSVPPNTTSRPKGPSRRASRTVPAVVVALPSPSVEAPPSPTSSRPQNRRRRSQSGKGLAGALPKINPPAHDDNLLRPNRSRLGPVPHSAPVKDTPPHLANNSFDMRNNIDALVERVRAVAMADNRPSTPGSHIDWAGDDDDSLPDLDDWGVTPVTGTTQKNQMMSPIVVDGLKSLPVDPIVKPLTPSPSVKEELLPSPTIEPLAPLNPPGKKVLTLSPRDKYHNHSERGKPRNHAAPQALSIAPSNDNTYIAAPPAATVPSPVVVLPTFTKAALHPSLPPKPVVAAEAAIPQKFRHGPGATPMRNPSPPKPASTTIPISPVVVKLPEEPETPGQVVEIPQEDQGIAQSIHAPSSAPEILSNDLLLGSKPREGLTASIHAPQNLLESVSAPSNLSSYSSPPKEPRNHNLTHTRAHTVGRPFQDHRDNSRTSRSGYTTPRGGMPTGGYHARTHSTPPAGSANRSPHARPVITGDAISRLARTIGNTTRVAAVAAAHD